MLKGARGVYLALGGLIVLALVLLSALLFALSVQERDDARERQRAAAHAGEQADERQPRCIYVPSVQFTFCRNEAAATANGEEYTYYDLKAQQEMARWAFGVFAISCLGWIASVVGIFFVARTLDAQLVANRDAHQRFLTEQRPWLALTVTVRTSIKRSTSDGGGFNVHINMTARNIGNLPAANVFFHAPDKARGVFSAGELNAFQQEIEQHRTEAPATTGDVVFPRDDAGITRSAKVHVPMHPESDFVAAFIPVFVSYRFEGDDRVHITPVVQYIGLDPEARPAERLSWEMPFHLCPPPD